MSTADALRQVERSRDEMVQFMLEMLKIKAVNPEGGGGGEYERALFVQKWVEKLGVKVSRYDYPDDRVPEKTRVNFTTVIEGRDSSRTLWFASHLDTVPEGSRDLWSTDPYEPIVKDGKIFGWFGESGHELGEFNWVHGIACPSENTLFIADMNNWRVVKVTLHPEASSTSTARR